jgi:hypothetical protein
VNSRPNLVQKNPLTPHGTLRVSDVIHICGHTTDFRQKVESLEVDHAPATKVAPKDDFDLKVVDHALKRPWLTAIQKLRAGEAALSKRHMLIGGKWVDSASGEVLEVEDRRTGVRSARSREVRPRMSSAP